MLCFTCCVTNFSGSGSLQEQCPPCFCRRDIEGAVPSSASQIRALDEAAGEAGVTLPVYVEVNMGGNRRCVEPGEPALALARQSTQAPHLAFGGLQAYHGSAQHLRGWEERRHAIGAADKAGRTRDLLARCDIECPTVTGAGTGTFEFEVGERRLYRIAMRLPHLHGRRLRPQSRPRRRADEGLRAEPLRVDDGDEPSNRGPRHRRRRPEGARFRLGPAPRLGRTRRHLRARLRRARPASASRAPPNRLQIGDKIRLVPGHCDPTVNRVDQL